VSQRASWRPLSGELMPRRLQRSASAFGSIPDAAAPLPAVLEGGLRRVDIRGRSPDAVAGKEDPHKRHDDAEDDDHPHHIRALQSA
jgi:hypothetical protein